MDKILKKVIKVLQAVYGYGILICLFGGGLTFLGYLAALIVGGSTATNICVFIYEEIYPKLVYLSTSMVLLGLLKMYLSGETALTAQNKKKR